ncbi:hypothetical protein BV22DRAFT_1133580 [Leucogyrophana mollusca]|uniref:Uncharacterized protein n=1 Tax=Leucogyrophana mollusca TaxID=85980 RepID=A0ACB8B3E1_9AGAM|nr:hypothetical protein BV22DRAFT_1133580 [Leucogyrophana mollusca]
MDVNGTTPIISTTGLLTLSVFALKLTKTKTPQLRHPASTRAEAQQKTQEKSLFNEIRLGRGRKDADVGVDAEWQGKDAEDEDAAEADNPAAAPDPYESHFGPSSCILTQATRTAVDQR